MDEDEGVAPGRPPSRIGSTKTRSRRGRATAAPFYCVGMAVRDDTTTVVQPPAEGAHNPHPR